MDKIKGLIESLEELSEEEGVSKLMQDKIATMIRTLQEDIELELRVDRIRSILEELDENNNIPNYIRTQLWNISAALELL